MGCIGDWGGGAAGGCRGLQRAAPRANALWNVEVYGSRNAIHREQLAGPGQARKWGPVEAVADRGNGC